MSDRRRAIMRGTALLLSTIVLIFLVDQLASGVFWFVRSSENNWVGQSLEQSPWTKTARAGFALHARDLTLTIDGDILTAVYQVTASADSPLAKRAVQDDSPDSGNDLVANVLGSVQVGEFRYGFTGSEYATSTLTFQRPLLSMTGDSASVTVTSDPFRLYRGSQFVLVSRQDNNVTVTSKDDRILVKATSVETWDASGANLLSVTNGVATLEPSGANVNLSFTMSVGNPASGWLDGLRGIGGMTIPIAGGLLSRLADVLPFAVLWWSLTRAADRFPGIRLVAMARKAVINVVVALVATAVLRFAFRLGQALEPYLGSSHDLTDWVLAGPLGLLVGGAALVWPVACLDIGSAGKVKAVKVEPGVTRLRSLALPVLLGPAMTGGYIWLIYGYLGSRSFYTSPGAPFGLILALATGVEVVTTGLIYFMFRSWRWRAGLVSVGLSAILLAATVFWPYLWYNTFSGDHANPLGKWTFFAIAVIVTAGLCTMSARITGEVFYHVRLRADSPAVPSEPANGPRRRFPWQALVTAAVIVGISACLLPDVFSRSGISDPHALGRVPSDLFEWLAALPDLLSWLVLALGILLAAEIVNLPHPLAGIPEVVPGSIVGVDPRPVARDLALPIAIQLMYWDDTWFYIPVTIIVGIILVRYLLLPRDLATGALGTDQAQVALKSALAGWRTADFVGKQRDALVTSGADILRDVIVSRKRESYAAGTDKLIAAQKYLDSTQDEQRQSAYREKRVAFSHRGTAPDVQAARTGLIVGALLGIVPIVITLLTTSPLRGDSGYPILDFLNGAAWNLVDWAGLGWFIGYYLPLIRGRNGTEKGIWLFVVIAAADLPANLVWDDAKGWTSVLVTDLQLLVFLVLTTVILADLRTLKNAGFNLADWPRVQNWRFVATWSTALLTAVATIALTFATTTVTDISQQLTPAPSSGSSTSVNVQVSSTGGTQQSTHK